jgi:hypothetical protein
MEVFIINFLKMIFIINYRDQSSTLLSAATWSDATAYAEGTGKQIGSITEPINPTLVLNSPLSSNFYQITLKNISTGISALYFVFEENYQSLNSWIELQSNTELTALTNSQRNYVSI